ncbi:hypothetical protein [Ruegeria arenilitoris]|uniref:hypothetical protein n=1 Tax=Ruegeria arenilitoris TaxID=1173585 RepID=UPI00147CD088|nr:hypothetical protein [Ruegeria arenilitoris]
MLAEIPLTNEEKLLIERKCLEEVSRAEDLDDDLRLPDSMLEEIVGTKTLKWTFLAFGLISGVVSLAALRWLDSALGYTTFLYDLGIPSVVSTNLPELLSLCVAANVIWTAMYSWAVEGRYHWATTTLNAQKRASVLHSVVECLTDVLGDAVPDLSDYAHVHEDSEPNRRMERLMGQSEDEYHKAQPRSRLNT